MLRAAVSRDFKTLAASVTAQANNIKVGSRVPTKFPDWVTIEVGTGGFATGRALSALAPSEDSSLTVLRDADKVATMMEHITTKKYRIERPEDAIVPIIIGLIRDDKSTAANRILAEVGPYLTTLRMYPTLTETEQPDTKLDLGAKFSFAEMMADPSRSRAEPATITEGTSVKRRFAVVSRNMIKWALFDLVKLVHTAAAPALLREDQRASTAPPPLLDVEQALAPVKEDVSAFLNALRVDKLLSPFPKKLTEPRSDQMRLVAVVAVVLGLSVPPAIRGAAARKRGERENAATPLKSNNQQAPLPPLPHPDLLKCLLRRVEERLGFAASDKDEEEGQRLATAARGDPKYRRHPRAYDEATRSKEMTEAYRMLAYEALRRSSPDELVDADAVVQSLELSHAGTVPFMSDTAIQDHVVPIIRSNSEVLRGPVATLRTRKARSLVGAAHVRKVLHAMPFTLQEHIEDMKNINSAETLALALGMELRQGDVRRRCGCLPDYYRDLYAHTLHAFARRRSLLLLNFERQTRLEDLPWVTAMFDSFAPTNDDAARTSSQQQERMLAAQRDVSPIVVALFTYYGGTLIPNALVSALRKPYLECLGVAVNDPSGRPRHGNEEEEEEKEKVGLMAELAQDIFMGDFNATYFANADRAVSVLAGSVYDRFFGLQDIRNVLTCRCNSQRGKRDEMQGFTAGNRFRSSGQLIEAMQVVTTHNILQLYEACQGSGLTPLQNYRQLNARAQRFHDRYAPPPAGAKHNKVDKQEEEANAFDPDTVDEPRTLVSRAGYRAAVEVVAKELLYFCNESLQYFRMLARRRIAVAVRQMLLFLSLRHMAGESARVGSQLTAELEADLRALGNCIPPTTPRTGESESALAQPARIARLLVEKLRDVMVDGKPVAEGFFGWV